VVTLVTRNANEVWFRLWRALAESAFGGSRSCFGVSDPGFGFSSRENISTVNLPPEEILYILSFQCDL
jgi:hypothetical protein